MATIEQCSLIYTKCVWFPLFILLFLEVSFKLFRKNWTFILIILVALYFQGQYEFIYRAIQHYISTETARLSSDNVRISGMYFASYLLTTPYYLSICFICSLIHSFFASWLMRKDWWIALLVSHSSWLLTSDLWLMTWSCFHLVSQNQIKRNKSGQSL